MPELVSDAVVLSKSAEPLSQKARLFLADRDGTEAKVWVFFTDKNVFSRQQFQAAAASVSLQDKAARRRAKTGMDRVVFADLPVAQQYVNQIVTLGARLRWRSNWLNAVSFVIPANKLDQIAALPFVASIRPVATFKRIIEPIEPLPDDTRTAPLGSALSPTAFNYGSAASQLSQIYVPDAHAQGYHGEGVTLAMFDTGFRTSHEVFASTFAEGRFIAQYDFIFHDSITANEPVDAVGQWDHGTLTWSTAAGMKDGQLYGPAFKANIILCKTEDIRSETPVEEDNWLAAVEWVSTLGADVISSSLSYTDWYNATNYDGRTCVTTIAANMADTLGILVVNAMGNSGPTSPSLGAPADAFKSLSCGAVNSSSTLASFSSRGPTYDGRTKPEVCARGVSTACATSSNNSSYGGASGTSLSTPLVAGAACLVIQARPSFPPSLVRQAMMETANNAATPNNNYGWGIINTAGAISWGAGIAADVTQGNAPMPVQFTGTSTLSPSSWLWDFGDGQTSADQNPSHVYTLPGVYNVALTVQTTYGSINNTKLSYIIALGDTLRFVGDSNFAGKKVMVSVHLANSQNLQSMIIPVRLPNSPYKVRLDSLRRGSRTSYFESMSNVSFDTVSNRFTVELLADNGGGAPPLAPGDGEVLKIFGKIDKYALGGVVAPVDTADLFSIKVRLYSDVMNYGPIVFPGQVSTKGILRCDVDYSNDGGIDISDVTRIIAYLYLGGPAPVTTQSGDCDSDLRLDISDVTYIIGYLYLGGQPPANP
jgi:PKD repeat protein